VVLVGSEKAVTGTKGCRVLYPQDGALVLDHPFVEIERPTRPANERRRGIVDRFRSYLLSVHAQDQFRRSGFRDVDWNVGSDAGPGVRPGQPQTLLVELDAGTMRDAWTAASRGRVIAVAGDDSPDADLFLQQVRLLAGRQDEVITLPLSERVVEEGVQRGAAVVVLASRAPGPAVRTVGGPVEVVAIGFTDGSCGPSAALYAAAHAHRGRCHEIVDKNGSGPPERQDDALDAIAHAAWGG
jgi:hypothetical protein